MDFSKLTPDELTEFLQMHGQISSPVHQIQADNANRLFTQLQNQPGAQFSYPVVDLYLATGFIQAGHTIPQKYSIQVIQQLTPEQKSMFGQILNLDPNDPNFTVRLIRILRILDALEMPTGQVSQSPGQVSQSPGQVSQSTGQVSQSPGQVSQSTGQVSQSPQTQPLWTWDVSTGEAPIPISWPVTREYPLDSILTWRNKIGKESQINSDLVGFDVNGLHKLYHLYNRYFFNNSLPPEINIEINPRLTKTAGKCGPCPGSGCGCKYRIQISRPVFQKLTLLAGQTTQSGGVECKTRLECLQLVFEHEMIHLAVKVHQPNRKRLDKRIYSAHGQLFKALVKSYFGQTRSTHSIGQIIMADEQGGKVDKGRLQVGDLVSYLSKGTLNKGVLVQKNPVNAIIEVVIGNSGSRMVKYDFLQNVLNDDMDIDFLKEKRDEIIGKLQYWDQLRDGDRVKVIHNEQVISGKVAGKQPRAKKIIIDSDEGSYIYRYNKLVLPDGGSSPQVSQLSNQPSASPFRPSSVQISRHPKITKENIQLGQKVKFSNLKGIFVKKNPSNAVILTLNHELYNYKYDHLHHVDSSDPDDQLLDLLFGEWMNMKTVYGNLRPGDQIRFTPEGYRTGTQPLIVKTGTVDKLRPRSETLDIKSDGETRNIFMTQLVI